MKPLFIVITGTTSSGKDTIKYELLKRYPGLRKVITTTTRPMRKREIDGEDLHFISVDEFRKRMDEGKFLETVEYAGNLYGTEKSEILDGLDKSIIWRIDPSMAANVKELITNHFPKEVAEELLKRLIVIYIKVDEATARQRLTQRGLETSEIERRINQDKVFWGKYHDKYDFVVENPQGQLHKTLQKVFGIIQNHK